jgi:hypothetical protein
MKTKYEDELRKERESNVRSTVSKKQQYPKYYETMRPFGAKVSYTFCPLKAYKAWENKYKYTTKDLYVRISTSLKMKVFSD